MDSANPYLPPEASLDIDSDASIIELASRVQRLGAAFLDGILWLIIGGPLMYILKIFEYSKTGQALPFSLTLGLITLSFIVFVALHGYFLKRDGQTIGKKIVGIKIVTIDNELPQFLTIILRRYLPLYLVTLIPVAGKIINFVDPLFVYRSDRRCVHDLIAGTKVVKVNKSV